MHLKQSRRGSRTYLSLVETYRDGSHVRTRTIKSLGYLDTLTEHYDDPVAHFTAYAQAYNADQARGRAPLYMQVTRTEEIPTHSEPTQRRGAAIALGCLDILGIKTFFQGRSHHAQFPYQAGRIFELLTVERMMHVSPKRDTWNTRASFPRRVSASFQDVYAALPYFATHADTLLHDLTNHLVTLSEHLHSNQRTHTHTAYVVLGTFAFSTQNDVDPARHLNATHKVRNPKVSLGIILNEDGIPLGYKLLPAQPRTCDILDIADYAHHLACATHTIVVAGSLDDADSVACSLLEKGYGFVFSQPAWSADPDARRWMRDPSAYIEHARGYRMKSRTRSLHQGSSYLVKDVVLWAHDYTLRPKISRDIASQAPSDTPTSSGRPPYSEGYVSVTSSETQLPAAMIFHIYREIWRLAEPFQVLESDFAPSPFPIPHADHIQAHFLICFTAFAAMRILRARIDWRYNAAQVAEALLKMEGIHLQDSWYLYSYRSEVTDALERALDLSVGRRIHQKKELGKTITQTRRAFEKDA